jgi:hypothetical protein
MTFHPSGLLSQMAVIFSDHQDDIDSSLSKVFGREVRLVKAKNFEKPIYEEYWPDIEGLAQGRRSQTKPCLPKPSLILL